MGGIYRGAGDLNKFMGGWGEAKKWVPPESGGPLLSQVPPKTAEPPRKVKKTAEFVRNTPIPRDLRYSPKPPDFVIIAGKARKRAFLEKVALSLL